MTLHEALDALIRFEERVMSFYIWVSSVTAEDAEVAHLFSTLAEQEQGHAERLRAQQRALVGADRRVAVEGVEQAVDLSVQAMNGFMSAHPDPGVDEVLAFTLSLESEAGEQLGRDLLRNSVPELAKTLDGLDREDAGHAEMLQECLALRRRRMAETP